MAWKEESLTIDLGFKEALELQGIFTHIIEKHKGREDDLDFAITLGCSQVPESSPIFKLSITDHEDLVVSLQSGK